MECWEAQLHGLHWNSAWRQGGNFSYTSLVTWVDGESLKCYMFKDRERFSSGCLRVQLSFSESWVPAVSPEEWLWLLAEWRLFLAAWNSSAMGKAVGKLNQPSISGCFWMSKGWQSRNATAAASLTWILQAQIQHVNLFLSPPKQGWEHSAILVHGFDNVTRGDCCQLWLKGCLMCSSAGLFL